MAKTILLTGKKYPNQVAVVDDEDYDRINASKWFAAGDGYNLYAVRTKWDAGKYRKVRMHVAIMEPPPGMEVDHIDGNGLNNCRSNLRVCTHAENMRNRKRMRTNSSGYMGVQKSGTQWVATIQVNGKLLGLGRFIDPADAARVRDAAAVRYYGEFANLNFPIGT